MQKREIQVMIKSTKTKNQRRISLMEYYIRKLLGLTEERLRGIYEIHKRNTKTITLLF